MIVELDEYLINLAHISAIAKEVVFVMGDYKSSGYYIFDIYLHGQSISITGTRYEEEEIECKHAEIVTLWKEFNAASERERHHSQP